MDKDLRWAERWLEDPNCDQAQARAVVSAHVRAGRLVEARLDVRLFLKEDGVGGKLRTHTRPIKAANGQRLQGTWWAIGRVKPPTGGRRPRWFERPAKRVDGYADLLVTPVTINGTVYYYKNRTLFFMASDLADFLASRVVDVRRRPEGGGAIAERTHSPIAEVVFPPRMSGSRILEVLGAIAERTHIEEPSAAAALDLPPRTT